jgi:3-oxoacyl-[acyl-carrier-protein] synthase III
MNPSSVLNLRDDAVPCGVQSRNVWCDTRSCAVLGMGHALPGNAVSTPQLLVHLYRQYGVDVRRSGAIAARRLGVEARHICRDFVERREPPRAGHSNAELAARALQSALQDAGLRSNELSFLIGHTATPGQPLPPNITRVAELIGYDGPFVELRQACTGFANALIMARGMLDAPNSGPIAIVGSETGSVFFDPLRAAEDHGQLVNLLQMGDGAAACVVGHNAHGHGAQFSHIYFGQIGRERRAGFEFKAGGSNHAAAAREVPEFDHDFGAVRKHGPLLFEQGIAAVTSMGIDLQQVDYIIPHQANGHMAKLLAPRIGVDASRIFVNADRIGNTGSAAIWLALTELRTRLRHGERVLVLGAEATKHMFGGMLYVHG